MKEETLWKLTSMLIAYTICYAPSTFISSLGTVIQLHEAFFATNMFTFQFITIANPLIQAYFRQEIKTVLISFKKVVCSKLKTNRYSP